MITKGQILLVLKSVACVPRWLLLMMLLSSSQTIADNLTAAAKLEAIKQALVDLALGTEVTLGSAAYLDRNGGLHETAVMSTNIQVRGIRVLSYLQEAGTTTARVDASMLSDSSCPGYRAGIRREATVRVLFDSDNANPNQPVGDHYFNELLMLTEQTLLSALSASKDWSVKSERQHANTYESMIYGTGADHVPYRFEIVFRDRKLVKDLGHYTQRLFDQGKQSGYQAISWFTDARPITATYESWPAKALEYELRLIDRATEQPLWRETRPLQYPRVDRGYGKASLPVDFKRQVRAATQGLISQVTASLHCYAQGYQLTAIAGDSKHLQINAGMVAGIKVGDQFLITDDAKLLDRAVRPSGLEMLALAQVVSVRAHSASLRLMAGPEGQAPSDLNNRVAVHL